MKSKLILLLMVAMMIGIVSAQDDFFYSPMNFVPGESSTHNFEINATGNISVVLPPSFSLVSGDLNGTNSISFSFSPDNITDEDYHVGEIYINGSFYSYYYLLSIDDSKIVDTKVEIGHGDFNYIDYDGIIGEDNTMIFSLVRVWGVGTDLLNEEAQDITFSCDYPKIIPNTIDSKYTATFGSSDIRVDGYMSRLEGASMFRIFVVSQEVDYEVGENYVVNCSSLSYDFEHTRITADVPGVNLSVRTLSPLIIQMSNNSGYVNYTIYNNESYDIRNIEFLWEVGTHTIRQELDELRSGEAIQYNLETNTSGEIDFTVNFIPEWMFNSRSPISYSQSTFETYLTGIEFGDLNVSDYYNDSILIEDTILETQLIQLQIRTLQDPIEGSTYRLTYYFYDENDVLVKTEQTEVINVGLHDIYIESDGLEPMIEEVYDVYLQVEMLNGNSVWQAFPMELVDVLTVKELTSNPLNGPGLYDVIIGNEYDVYEEQEQVVIGIVIKNTGDAPDEDTVLTYWLESPDGAKYGETKEQFLEVPVGTTYIERSLTVPLSAINGEWKVSAEYETVVQPTIAVYDSFAVQDLTFFDKLRLRAPQWIQYNWFISLLLFLLLLGAIMFIAVALATKEKKKRRWKKTVHVDSYDKEIRVSKRPDYK